MGSQWHWRWRWFAGHIEIHHGTAVLIKICLHHPCLTGVGRADSQLRVLDSEKLLVPIMHVCENRFPKFRTKWCFLFTAPDTQIWNKPPEVIYVQFETAKTWRIEGLLRDNVFPVAAQRKPWFLDRGRKSPRLRITCLQFPLAPGFAITAHVAQGQTLRDGVIADFNISTVASVFTTYVAATRVTGREKLLIMRPFPAGPFQKGNSIGRELLLRVWRGDRVDWESLRAKYLEERTCGECAENKGKTAYTVGQWKRGDTDRVCRECIARHRDAGEPYQCNVCRFWFSEEAFPTKHRRNESTCYRVCCACEVQKPCHRCKVKKPMTEYTASAWKARHIESRTTLRRREILQEVRAEVESMVRGRSAQPQQHKSSSPHQTQQQPVTDMREKEPKPNMTQLRPGLAGTRGPPSANDRKRKSPSDGSVTRSNETSADAAEEMRCSPKPPRVKDKRYRVQHSDNPRAAPATTSVKYQCPYCQASAESTIKNGKVHVAGHCGKQFRVSNGRVVRRHTHSCPQCGTKVQSACVRGQIKCSHKKPNGKACPTKRWRVKG